MKNLLVALAVLLACSQAFAVEPSEILDDPVLESRAREISKELRCVVCQNQSIDDSNADLARDMRVLVRDRVLAGDSNQQVLDYMVSRYGDFVLLTPPFKAGTYALWLGPGVIGALGIFALVSFYRSKSKLDAASDTPPGTVAAGLSEEEQKRYEKLLENDQV